jgi:hypothetical protein
MVLDFSTQGQVKITQQMFLDDLLAQFDLRGRFKTPASDHLFSISEDSSLLSTARARQFHSVVASLLYLAKRTRPDILLAVGFLTTRVLHSTEEDWDKLLRVLEYLYSTREMFLTLGANSDLLVTLYADASFAIHNEGKSHTGALLTTGIGTFHVKSSKQTLVTKSSTESEIVAMTDALAPALWARLFLTEQGYNIPPVDVRQDNMSTIALSIKGKSTSDRTRHINIRYFWITDLITRGEVTVKHTQTNEMIADLLTKPLQGELFITLRNKILGC